MMEKRIPDILVNSTTVSITHTHRQTLAETGASRLLEERSKLFVLIECPLSFSLSLILK